MYFLLLKTGLTPPVAEPEAGLTGTGQESHSAPFIQLHRELGLETGNKGEERYPAGLVAAKVIIQFLQVIRASKRAFFTIFNFQTCAFKRVLIGRRQRKVSDVFNTAGLMLQVSKQGRVF